MVFFLTRFKKAYFCKVRYFPLAVFEKLSTSYSEKGLTTVEWPNCDDSRLYIEDFHVSCVQGSILRTFLFQHLHFSHLHKVIEPCSQVVIVNDSCVMASAKDEEILQGLLELT